MLLLKGDPPADAEPNIELINAMGRYAEELAQAGVLLAAEGLFPSATGARVVYAKGKRTVVDGPFAEAKELVAGFYLIEVKSLEEAIEWASRCPFEYAVQGDQEAVIEVRRASSSAAEVFPELADAG
ncbi:MAG TPA: YciI family protein [Micromonosporaceae bacterium]